VEKANEYAEKSNTFMEYCKQYELQIVALNSKIEKLEWDLDIYRRVGASQNLIHDDSDDETQPILKGTLAAESMGKIFGAAKKKDKASKHASSSLACADDLIRNRRCRCDPSVAPAGE
jgi:hypothetical protein